MNGFWLRYGFAAIAGTAAVYFGVPELQARFSDDIKAHADIARERFETVFDDLADSVDRLGEQPTDVEPMPDQPLAQTRAQAETPPGWAVVLKPDAPSYTSKGKFRERIPAGTLLDISRIADTATGEFALCELHAGNGVVPNVLMRTEHLDLRPGTRDAAHPRDIQMRVRRGRLRNRIDELQRQLQHLGREKNPHAARFKEMLAQRRELRQRATALTRQRDDSVGAERMEAAEALRAMKQESALLNERLSEVNRQYEAWQGAYLHSVDGLRDQKSIEAEIARKQSELDRIEAAL